MPKEKLIYLQLPDGGIVRPESPKAAQLAVENLVQQAPHGGILNLPQEEIDGLIAKIKPPKFGVNPTYFE